VIADALTSVGAIGALLVAWYTDLVWLDPLVAIVAAIVIALWAYGLIRDTGHVLLDMEAEDGLRQAVVQALEKDGDSRVVDLHLWSVGPGALTLVASVVTHADRKAEYYKSVLPAELKIYHPIVEVQHCMVCSS
jgi:cation diffusion facilitator family transporter